MNRTSSAIDKPDPWRVPVTVAQIPEIGLHRDLEADLATRVAMAEVVGLHEISSVNASLDVMPYGKGRFRVAGRVRARLWQTCVVTLDPIENDIDEQIDLIFAPPEQISDPLDEITESETEVPDPPELIANGVIDLGRLVTDALFLSIDPYPRKVGAVFEPPVETADPEAHPFAGLKALRLHATAPATNKPKR